MATNNSNASLIRKQAAAISFLGSPQPVSLFILDRFTDKVLVIVDAKLGEKK